MILGDIVKEYRTRTGMNMQEFADKAGLSKAYISILERNYNPRSGKPPIPSLKTIKAVALAVSMDFNDVIAALDGDQKVSLAPTDNFVLPDNLIPIQMGKPLPLIGSISCGKPLLADENVEDMVACPENIHADFCLRCKGDSMIGARIMDGDIVYIRQQDDVDDGQIGVVIIDGEATLKRVYKIGSDRIELRPENPAFPVLTDSGEELNHIRIIGCAVAFTSAIR